MKAVNEVYKTYNISQVPLAVLDFRLPPESVDINVSPDKRTVFVHSERNLIAALREALDHFYAPTRSNFAVGGASQISRMLASQKPVIDNDEDDEEDEEDENEEDAEDEEEEEEAEALDNGDADSDEEADEGPQPAPRKRRPDTVVATLDTTTASWSPQKRPRTSLRDKLQSYRSSATPGPASAVPADDPEPEPQSEPEPEVEAEVNGGGDEDVEMEEPEIEEERPSRSSRASRSSAREVVKESPLQRFWNNATRRSRPEEEREQEVEIVKESPTQTDRSARRTELLSQLKRRSQRAASEEPQEEPQPQSEDEIEVEHVQVKISESQIPRSRHRVSEAIERRTPSPEADATEDLEETADEEPGLDADDAPEPLEVEERGDSSQEVDDLCCGSSAEPAVGQAAPEEREAVHVEVDHDPPAPVGGYRDEIVSALPASEATLRFDMERLQRKWASLSLNPSSKPKADAVSKLKKGQAASAAGVQNRDLASAEAALSRSIDKADFARMRILGQFNRGFIIAGLPSSTEGEEDLYIIDQHASDEKYNFETLQRAHRMQAQALLAPKTLQLSAGDEITLIEHQDVVERNGFEIKYDPDATPGRRVKLCAVPVSRDTVFDESDLAELIHRINDGHDNPRTSKARAMFAMRACRRSVMIGTALAKPKMEQLVRNMGTIDQPWNCPHGRPTMRHLTTTEPTDQSGRDRIDWSKVDL